MRAWWCVAAALVAFAPGLPVSAEEGTPIAVIVHKSNPVESLSLNQVRDLLHGRVGTWPNGRRVVLVLSDDHAMKGTVLKWCCGQTPAQYDAQMLRAVFTGDVPAAPKRLDTSEAVAKFVFNVAGGIGFVLPPDATDAVRVVRIGGLAPSDPGYPLRLR